jgi:hypothetical protein
MDFVTGLLMVILSIILFIPSYNIDLRIQDEGRTEIPSLNHVRKGFPPALFNVKSLGTFEILFNEIVATSNIDKVSQRSAGKETTIGVHIRKHASISGVIVVTERIVALIEESEAQHEEIVSERNFLDVVFPN